MSEERKGWIDPNPAPHIDLVRLAVELTHSVSHPGSSDLHLISRDAPSLG